MLTSTSDTALSVSVDGGAATSYTVADVDVVTGADMVGALNAAFTADNVGVTVAGSTGAALAFTGAPPAATAPPTSWSPPARSWAPAIAASFYTNGALTKTNATAQTVDELAAGINANTSLTGKVKASNDGGRLSIQNLSTEDLSVVGATSGGVINADTGAANTATIGGNTVRKNLITQFNDLRSQLDKLADNSSFNGVNLLRGDTLKLVFNEINASSISIVSQDANGINTGVLGIGTAAASEFSSNTSLDSRLDELSNALSQLRSQASAFGSNLSIVQNRRNHQGDDQHAADRFGHPRARRRQRGSREPARPANPPAALHHGAVAGFAGRPRRAAPVLSQATTVQNRAAGPLAPPFFFAHSESGQVNPVALPPARPLTLR